MNNHSKAIWLMVLCTLFTSTGQILWKEGLGRADMAGSWLTLVNWPFIMGFGSYGVGAVLMLMAFKRGELSVLYPIVATSYVWVTIASAAILSETVSAVKWAGIGVIVLSVSMLGRAGKMKQGEKI